MSKLRHFSELTKSEIDALWNELVTTAIDFTDQANIGGLSEGGSHNLYNSLRTAVESEWESAKHVIAKREAEIERAKKQERSKKPPVKDSSNMKRPQIEILPDGRMTAANAAKYLGLSEKTLATRRCYGRGPAYVKPSGRIYYYQSALDEWLQQGG